MDGKKVFVRAAQAGFAALVAFCGFMSITTASLYPTAAGLAALAFAYDLALIVKEDWENENGPVSL
jgi:hypothetical protein